MKKYSLSLGLERTHDLDNNKQPNNSLAIKILMQILVTPSQVLDMCVCVCVCVCAHVCVHVCVYVCVHVCMFGWLNIDDCQLEKTHTYIHTCTDRYTAAQLQRWKHMHAQKLCTY